MFENFINNLESRGVSDQTVKNYCTSWNRFVKWITNDGLEEVDAWKATQKDISDFKKYLLRDGGRKGQPAKPSTLQLTFVHLKAIFRFFVEQGYIPDNPVDRIERPPRARRVIKWLNRNEQNALLREVRASGSQRNLAIFLMFLRTGLRVHELCEAKLTDLTISDRKGSIYVRGKGDKDREIPLNAEVRFALQSYLDTRKDDNSPYIFTSQRSLKCSTRAIQSLVEKYREKTKISHLTCHALRHTFGHDLVTADPPVRLDVAAMLMGHYKEDGTPNIEMTMIYTVPGSEDLASAVDLISWI